MSEASEAKVGRNEPCPCGSGRKYKRCCGMTAAPESEAPDGAAGPEAFDPSKVDPETMAKLSKAVKRLPRAQLQRFQSIMSRAMAGKDVSREAASLEASLPPDVRSLMSGLAGMGAGAPGAPLPEPEGDPMSPDEARRLVEEAVKAGKIGGDEAEALLKNAPAAKPGFWKGLLRKKGD